MRAYRRKQPLETKNKHQVIRFLSNEMHHQQMTSADLCERAGFAPDTLKWWRHRTMPRINDVEAALNVLGYELTVRRKKRT